MDPMSKGFSRGGLVRGTEIYRQSIIMGLLTLAAAGTLADTSYPGKAIRIVVPFAPGGGADIMGRALGQKLSLGLGQPVVIDNRAGAGGRIGAEAVAKAMPDGYTLFLATTSTLVWAPALYDKLTYDPRKDFASIAPFASAFTVLVVHPSIPAKSVKELIALVKSKPGELNYASSGIGAPAHLAAELFNYAANIRTTHIAYKGSAPGTIALISGETDLMFSNILPALSPVKAGKLRALAITSIKRSSVLPDLPTVAETGLPGFEVYVFYGLVAPAGTPKEIVERLHGQVSRALESPVVKERLANDGAEPMITGNPDEFTKIIRTEWEKWSKLIRQAGIRGE
jgi:tripartite-type tricarboxylate transporter receptor subunit TctC